MLSVVDWLCLACDLDGRIAGAAAAAATTRVYLPDVQQTLDARQTWQTYIYKIWVHSSYDDTDVSNLSLTGCRDNNKDF